MNESNIERLDDDFVKAIMIDNRMIDDPFIQNAVYQLIKNRIDEAKVGVLKVHGNYSIVSGDPYALCQSMFGLEVTGLLKAGEIYNKYWRDYRSEKLACFRAPMTCHNNIRLVHPVHSHEADYWYQYMTTCTIFNAWDTAAAALNGMDFDGSHLIRKIHIVKSESHSFLKRESSIRSAYGIVKSKLIAPAFCEGR